MWWPGRTQDVRSREEQPQLHHMAHGCATINLLPTIYVLFITNHARFAVIFATRNLETAVKNVNVHTYFERRCLETKLLCVRIHTYGCLLETCLRLQIMKQPEWKAMHLLRRMGSTSVDLEENQTSEKLVYGEPVLT